MTGIAMAKPEPRLCEWCSAELPEGHPYPICDLCGEMVEALIEREAKRAVQLKRA